jgi:hypothetical protein
MTTLAGLILELATRHPEALTLLANIAADILSKLPEERSTAIVIR